MSRSFKKIIGHYHLCIVHSRIGKKKTSRSIRNAVRRALKKQDPQEDFEFVHLQDRKRGNKGSRCIDYGWSYFGDGYTVFHTDRRLRDLDDPFKEWLYLRYGVK